MEIPFKLLKKFSENKNEVENDKMNIHWKTTRIYVTPSRFERIWMTTIELVEPIFNCALQSILWGASICRLYNHEELQI